MQADNEGFRYPKIDYGKCTHCGACQRICPSSQNKSDFAASGDEPVIYGAWSLNSERRINSTSGGIFSELAEYVIQNGGSVVGARYTSSFDIEHCVINRIGELDSIRQSKYAQSRLNDVFLEIDRILKEGRTVLFCGTPCQVVGLKVFLGKEYENLVLCDFICRGVNSPKVYRLYLDMLESKFGARVEKVQFKNKKYGWHRFHTYVKFQNGKEYYGDRQCDYFMAGYLQSNLFIRPSCHQCQYKSKSRVADITLGDFWGINETRPHLDANRGTSVVMLNSSKGRELFERIEEKIVCERCTYEEVLHGNVCLLSSVEKKGDRETFFADLNTMSFQKAIEKYSPIKRSTWIKYVAFRMKYWLYGKTKAG